VDIDEIRGHMLSVARCGPSGALRRWSSVARATCAICSAKPMTPADGVLWLEHVRPGLKELPVLREAGRCGART
jgi:hypothetical protein